MKTISDFLELIKNDNEIIAIIQASEFLKKDYRPRNRHHSKNSARTESGIAMKHFWSSLDGIKVRMILETKYGLNLGDTRLRGAIKTALALYFTEVVGE